MLKSDIEFTKWLTANSIAVLLRSRGRYKNSEEFHNALRDSRLRATFAV